MTARWAKLLPWWHYVNEPVYLESNKTYKRIYLDINGQFIARNCKNVKVKKCVVTQTQEEASATKRFFEERKT